MPFPLARLGMLAAVLIVTALAAPSAASADVSTSIVRGTLVITSDDEADFVRLFMFNAAPNSLRVATGADGAEQTFDRRQFDRIQITGNGGDDSVQVDPTPVFTDTEPTTINAGPGADTVRGGDGPETILGDGGIDRVSAGGGDDTVAGGAESDILEGGQGEDIVTGGSGEDFFRHDSGDGSDAVDGGADRDMLLVDGTSGIDVVNVSDDDAGNLSVRVLRPETERIDAPAIEEVNFNLREGADVVSSGQNVQYDLRADGDEGDDEIRGGPGADDIDGGAGSDELFGSGGDDKLAGDAQNDVLDGGAGADALRGGSGIDGFLCDQLDTVLDLEPIDAAPGCAVPGQPALQPGPGQGGGAPQPVAPAQPAQPPAGNAGELPRGALGFARPRVALTRTGVKVVVRNTHSAPIRIAIAAKEKRGRKLHSYARVTKTIAAGRRVTVALKAPRALLRQLKAAKSAGKRRPSVTLANLATGGKLTARR